ncbi:MAG: hypothetical protein QXF58_04985 [Desulfurococcaceae archaeon]
MPLKYLHRRDVEKLMQEANIISNDVSDPSTLIIESATKRRIIKVRKRKSDEYEVVEDAVAVEAGQQPIG